MYINKKKIQEEITWFVIIFVSFSIIILLPSLLLYFFGYQPRQNWNDNAVKTNTTIIQTHITQLICDDSDTTITPNPIDPPIPSITNTFTGLDDNSNVVLLSSNRYECYYVYAFTLYTTSIDNKTNYFQLTIYFAIKASLSSALEQFNNNPINKTIEIYYNKKNPTDTQMSLDDPKGYLIASICIISIGSMLLLMCISWILFIFNISQHYNINKC